MNILQEKTNHHYGSLTRSNKKYNQISSNMKNSNKAVGSNSSNNNNSHHQFNNTPRKQNSAFRMEMARLHESVVDLKMKLATAQAKLQTNEGNMQNSNDGDQSIDDNIKLQEALNDRVKALSHDLLKAEAKNRKLRRLLETSKKKYDEEQKLKKAKKTNRNKKKKQKKKNKEKNHINSENASSEQFTPRGNSNDENNYSKLQQQTLTPITKKIMNNTVRIVNGVISYLSKRLYEPSSAIIL